MSGRLGARRLLGRAVLIGVVVAVGIAALRQADESPEVRQTIAAAKSTLARLPDQVERLARQARERWDEARRVFGETRAESERALLSQLQEAKQRGALPPV